MTKRKPARRRFTIELPDPAVQRLKGIVKRDNENNGAHLTLTEWITHRLLETAVQDQLAAAARSLQEQAQADANRQLRDALTATRDSLIEQLGMDLPPQGGNDGPE